MHNRAVVSQQTQHLGIDEMTLVSVKDRRRGYARAFGVGAIASIVVLTIWATATGPRVMSTASLGDLRDYEEMRSSLMTTALLIWATTLLTVALAWHLVMERRQSREANGRTWFKSDRIVPIAMVGVGLLVSNLNLGPGFVIATVPDASMKFTLNPAGAAGVLVILSALLAYVVAGCLELSTVSASSEGAGRDAESPSKAPNSRQ